MWTELRDAIVVVIGFPVAMFAVLRLVHWIGEPFMVNDHERRQRADLISRATKNPYKFPAVTRDEKDI